MTGLTSADLRAQIITLRATLTAVLHEFTTAGNLRDGYVSRDQLDCWHATLNATGVPECPPGCGPDGRCTCFPPANTATHPHAFPRDGQGQYGACSCGATVDDYEAFYRQSPSPGREAAAERRSGDDTVDR